MRLSRSKKSDGHVLHLRNIDSSSEDEAPKKKKPNSQQKTTRKNNQSSCKQNNNLSTKQIKLTKESCIELDKCPNSLEDFKKVVTKRKVKVCPAEELQKIADNINPVSKIRKRGKRNKKPKVIS